MDIALDKKSQMVINFHNMREVVAEICETVGVEVEDDYVINGITEDIMKMLLGIELYHYYMYGHPNRLN